MELLKISELAKITNTSIHMVRNYISERLILACDHTQCGYGLFNSEAVERLEIIRSSKLAGLKLSEIKPLIKALNKNDPINRELMLKLENTIKTKTQSLNQFREVINNLPQ